MTRLARLMNFFHRAIHGTDAFPPEPEPEFERPYVGMQLCCPKWGKDYALIEIVRVATDGSTDAMYKHVIMSGKQYTSQGNNCDTPNQPWIEFSTIRYNIVPKEEPENVK